MPQEEGLGPRHLHKLNKSSNLTVPRAPRDFGGGFAFRGSDLSLNGVDTMEFPASLFSGLLPLERELS